MRVLGLLLVLLLPVEALALSCLRPSVERSFHQANKAEELYVVVTGRMTFNARKLPKGGAGNQRPPEMTRIAGRLKGSSLNAQGFKTPFDQKVTLEVACFGPWCGGAQSGTDVLAFVRRDGGQYFVGVNPCGGYVFANPNAAMLKSVRRCFRGGACKAKQP